MKRSITVKGTGNLQVKPDLIILKLTLESHDNDYKRTMALAAEDIRMLQEAVQGAGFDKSDLKTTDYRVNTHYERYRDSENNYKRRFAGYICEQVLNLRFDFNQEVLANVLTAIAKAKGNPKMDIRFSVKDKDAVNEELLIAATSNARQKAEILAKASGLQLGKIIRIDYNWSELHLYSPVDYDLESQLMSKAASFAPDIEPEDINVNDTVTFIWEIE